jgi:excisionase family DNA binding protein
MAEEWLSLHEAAEMIGVHPSTVRSWADQGMIPVHRTQGGHRRFRRDDIQLWLHSRQFNGRIDPALLGQNMLRRTRMQIGEGHLEGEDWYRKLDPESREQYRQSGRSLLQGLLAHLGNDREEGMQVEARSLGYEYASRGQRCGLSGVEAAHAFLFFRTSLLESMMSVYEDAGVRSPQVWTEMFRKVTSFTDNIMITLLETYEAYQRGNR